MPSHMMSFEPRTRLPAPLLPMAKSRFPISVTMSSLVARASGSYFGLPVSLATSLTTTAVTGLPLGATVLTSLVFLPGDIIKVVLATLLTLTLWKAYPPVFGRVRKRRAVATVA